MKNPVLPILGALVLTMGIPASAVSLDSDGKGQALIFPYYTAQSAAGNPFNTLISIVNHASDTKVIRVRFREGRNAKEAASFNLYLSPNDTWTGAVVPTVAGGTGLFTTDLSCTNPAFAAAGGLSRSVTFLPGAAFRDSMGREAERTREGWIEAIEMATLVGESAAAVAHAANGEAANCPRVQGLTPSLLLGAPTGGLSGTLTLINVASGEDFTVNAEALAGLSRTQFYRHPENPYPDFNAAEIDPVSVVVANGFVYRSLWSRPADAVSAVLMRASWQGEFTFDSATRSNSEFVITFPTRQHHVTPLPPPPGFEEGSNGLGGTPPFSAQANEERVLSGGFTREAGIGRIPPIVIGIEPIWGISIFTYGSSVAHFVPIPAGQVGTSVLGALHRATVYLGGGIVSNGWFGFTRTDGRPLTSLPASTKMDIATGAVTVGAHRYYGLPVVGLAVRTFENGTLTCGTGACQGNYGGAFPLKYSRTIE